MRRKNQSPVLLLAILAIAGTQAWAAEEQHQDSETEARLRELEARQQQLEVEVRRRDARIEQLESEAAHRGTQTPPQPRASQISYEEPDKKTWGDYEPGKGFVLLRSDLGEVNFSIYSYVRYLDQDDLEDEYIDSFGREFEVSTLNQMQVQKVNLTFKGWLFDPKFQYRFYTWTSNSNQGEAAQVVVAGKLSYAFHENFNFGAGIDALPTTRTTNGTFPTWFRTDHRTIADEFFRGSYTTGLFAWGDITEKSDYRIMIGNNLSQLGVSANELDDHFETVSGAVWWMPTTGEYGPGNGFGDYEFHTEPATLFGLHYTHSREDSQGQPEINSFDNSQIRLSDGTRIFSPNPFDNDVNIRQATYEMAALNAGVKYCGYSLDVEYYYREVDNFSTILLPDAEPDATLPVKRLTDQGLQVQASTMLIPKTLQMYLSGSKINGEYGDPWDMAFGFKYYPFKRREVRWTTQLLYLDDSPVGYNSVPFARGGNGVVVNTEFEIAF
ncbi:MULTISPECIES: DNA-binding protein [Microbulbifer]|uniref:DNA-binding protein n=1 Tax=Microbulbifer TaxID=48073 RepID=UPI000AAD05ED|nr:MULTISPECIES: DNA-binding protein [Microbulbifer]